VLASDEHQETAATNTLPRKFGRDRFGRYSTQTGGKWRRSMDCKPFHTAKTEAGDRAAAHGGGDAAIATSAHRHDLNRGSH
jgi:hypothetical protein